MLLNEHTSHLKKVGDPHQQVFDRISFSPNGNGGREMLISMAPGAFGSIKNPSNGILPICRAVCPMKINDYVKVIYLGEDNPLTLRTGKAYIARILKMGWYGIVDETGEEYAYPPEIFAVLADD